LLSEAEVPVSDFVYLKYTGKGGRYQTYLEYSGPFVFEPYLKLPVATYARWREFFDFTGEIILVEPSEYEEWEREKAEREAEVHYCGDYGGVTSAGGFCCKRVDGPGMRCEHHGGGLPEQGSFGPGELERPSEINRGGRGRLRKR